MWCVVVVCKPNLVKDLCPRLLLDLCFVLRLGLGQAFQHFGIKHAVGGRAAGSILIAAVLVETL